MENVHRYKNNKINRKHKNSIKINNSKYISDDLCKEWGVPKGF